MRKMTKRMQDSLYHDLIFPDEALEIRAKARDFADRIVAPRAYEIATTEESRDSFPRDVFKALANLEAVSSTLETGTLYNPSFFCVGYLCRTLIFIFPLILFP